MSVLRRWLRALGRPKPTSASAETRPTGYQQIELEYPVVPEPRWGHGKPIHPRIEEKLAAGKDHYRRILHRLPELESSFAAIPRQPNPEVPGEPAWLNDFLPSLDSAVLYAFVAWEQPARYFEIGSGESTKFVRRAIRDHGLETRVVSVDPHPRSEIDALCDHVVRQPLESVDLTLFDQLRAGDILFFDGSHRVFTNSDTTVFFLEVLPRLASGVLVQIHDIYLPRDYPPDWNGRFYSEQYLLAMALLAGDDLFEVILPNDFVGLDPELAPLLQPLWQIEPLQDTHHHGQSFWLRTR